MAESKLNVKSPFISAESLAIGVAAESITTAGGTIPQGCGNIWFYVPTGDNVHWHPTGTPSTSFGHKVIANKWGMLTHAQHGAEIFSDDGSDVTMMIVYERGAGRQDAAHSISLPN